MHQETLEPLVPNCYYHIYNRGNNRENIFIEPRNYDYFLQLWARYVSPIADTYAYALMRNHFHFLVKMKQPNPPDFYFSDKHPVVSIPNRSPRPVRCILSQQFANCFNAYAKSINKAYNRTGSLFQERFRRKCVDRGIMLQELVFYIHGNPQKHGFVNDYKKYEHTSFHSMLRDVPTKLTRQEVLEWFGGRDNFLHYHEQYRDTVLERQAFLEHENDD
ncbi:Transposase IS200 like [Cnuella takakiae]|uniref:Transposase IS200 like n=1 Tax=Cnuella takakiae TaxID=1302690 RepID=A0A1M5FC50_9BACT|nr:transposase [Cnuella takakiae]OLY91038.1 hypothetical protein BUE76_03335 [Cnuella takakiae]SHF88601.1 Transposase IS200 like [Cnuella takakiae]